MTPILRTILPHQAPPPRRGIALGGEAIDVARRIIDDVQARGFEAVVEWSRRLGDVPPGQAPTTYDRAALRTELDRVDAGDRAVMERTAGRIVSFARSQRDGIREITHSIPGGEAGHWLAPVESAGCYAPGGRFPLPSSVLMTVIAARVAGVETVVVASPKPTAHTLAAAAIAEADLLIPIGGAQAIAAMALGAGDVPRCDVIVGPGNRYVTAAKQLLAGVVGIDMLAGPSEVLIVADETADARLVAADLLAQAEHDPDARAILVSTSLSLIEAVNAELSRQLTDLPTAAIASAALIDNSFAVACERIEHAIEVASTMAPEHLEVMTRDAANVARRIRHFGAVFIGCSSAEVLGDYGAGPNHVLPTAGAARFSTGLSVFTFLRPRTWMRIDDSKVAGSMYTDAAAFARLEGLEAHARAAEARQS
jgi:phosphoribosyl-ATP pyrophosphohydrolase/phosphoribosyl-AMP cyclohydrolase/histidinol dehydrogenase